MKTQVSKEEQYYDWLRGRRDRRYRRVLMFIVVVTLLGVGLLLVLNG